MPSIAKADSQAAGAKPAGRSAPAVRAVVVTPTLKVVGVVELNAWLAGTVQLAPAGAPVQLSIAVPPIPSPPIERV